MSSKNRRWLTATIATLGAGALTFGGAALPAAADAAADEPTQLASATDKYEIAASYTGETTDELKALEEQGLIKISDKGFVKYIDTAKHDHADELSTFGDHEATGAAIPGSPEEGSRPDAPVTVYLDFDGEVLEGKHWNTDSGIETLDFAPADAVSDREAVWAAVAEDYAPFNVNVTTTRPSDDKLYKTSADDNEYGSHVIITDSYDEVLPEAAGSGGIAWLGGTGSEYLSGALVFTEGTDGDPKIIADIATHESGHNFGLNHDGIEGSDTGEYYVPTEGVWGTIMGAPYYVPLSQWSNGGYAGATNDEDDLGVITDRGAAEALFLDVTLPDGTPYTESQICVGSGDPQNPQPGDVFYAVVDGQCTDIQLTLVFDYTDRADFAADDHGDDAGSATTLDNESDSFKDTGVIGNSDDVDVFAFTTAGGPVSASVEVASTGPNLDAKLTLTDTNGDVLDENNPESARESFDVASGLGATVSADVEAGTYYLTVQGVGAGDPSSATPDNANGYTAYGSLGNYTLTGDADAFVTEPIVIETPADGTEIAGGEEIEVSGTATPEATVTLTVSTINGTGIADEVNADEDGNWSGTITAGEFGATEITAAQTVGGIAVPETDTVTVLAPEPSIEAPVITAPEDGSTTEDNTPTISGTGVAGAAVNVTVTAADGTEVNASVAVAEDGTWAVATTELADGEYTVVATQSLDGITSDNSNTVTFTVSVPTLAAPVITAPEDGSTTEDSTPTISGTGVAGATVTVSVTAADGTVVYGEAVVAADGTWTLDVTELANGEYTVIASQALDGVASDNSTAVAFTVAVPAGNGGNGDDDNLATTGSDFNALPFAAAAGVMLLVGGGIAFYARRKSLQDS